MTKKVNRIAFSSTWEVPGDLRLNELKVSISLTLLVKSSASDRFVAVEWCHVT